MRNNTRSNRVNGNANVAVGRVYTGSSRTVTVAPSDKTTLAIARREMANAVLHAAHGRKEFTVMEVLEYTALNEYDLKALGGLLIDACNMGALQSTGDGRWRVMDRGLLGTTGFGGVPA